MSAPGTYGYEHAVNAVSRAPLEAHLLFQTSDWCRGAIEIVLALPYASGDSRARTAALEIVDDALLRLTAARTLIAGDASREEALAAIRAQWSGARP